MSVNEVIMQAVIPIVPVCVPDLYDGTETTYCTFQYSEFPRSFGDGVPHAVLYMVQVHLLLPAGKNPLRIKKQLRQALLRAGFTAPLVENATEDKVLQHYVFECEYAEGFDDGD